MQWFDDLFVCLFGVVVCGVLVVFVVVIGFSKSLSLFMQTGNSGLPTNPGDALPLLKTTQGRIPVLERTKDADSIGKNEECLSLYQCSSLFV